MVGGYDKAKGKGNIRLYKVLNYENLEVEEIDSIKFDEFKGAISCITQLRDPKFIILSCWDGNIYSFFLSIPNLYPDEKIGNKSFFDFFSFNIIISYLFANLDGKMPLYQNMELNLITNFFSLVSIFFYLL